jgi:hypothetical protein
MKCLDCPREYIGQTGRRFSTRYKEHIHDIRHNSSSTRYSEHILNTGHTYGTMENTMDVIETNKKGQYLNTLENYHIYIEQPEKIRPLYVLIVEGHKARNRNVTGTNSVFQNK